MGMTQDEWKQRKPKAPAPDPAQDPKTKFRMLLQDVVTAEQLTTDEHWNRYLTWLSGARKQAADNAEFYKAVLTNSSIVSHDELIKAKIAVANCEAIRETLEWCMELPVQLKNGATEVREQLKLLEKENEDGTTNG